MIGAQKKKGNWLKFSLKIVKFGQNEDKIVLENIYALVAKVDFPAQTYTPKDKNVSAGLKVFESVPKYKTGGLY